MPGSFFPATPRSTAPPSGLARCFGSAHLPGSTPGLPALPSRATTAMRFGSTIFHRHDAFARGSATPSSMATPRSTAPPSRARSFDATSSATPRSTAPPSSGDALVRQRHLQRATPCSTAPPSTATPCSAAPPSRRDALFLSATFKGDASFVSATSGATPCSTAPPSTRCLVRQRYTFKGNVPVPTAPTFRMEIGGPSFRAQTFSNDVFFNEARFGPGRADFGLATFERVAQFDRGRVQQARRISTPCRESAPSAWQALDLSGCRISSRPISRKRRALTMCMSSRRKVWNS